MVFWTGAEGLHTHFKSESVVALDVTKWLPTRCRGSSTSIRTWPSFAAATDEQRTCDTSGGAFRSRCNDSCRSTKPSPSLL